MYGLSAIITIQSDCQEMRLRLRDDTRIAWNTLENVGGDKSISKP